MGIRLSDHAKRQLKRRSILLKVIEGTVYKSDEILPSFRGRKLRRKRVGGKILEVVTITEGSRITVVTAYFLKEES